MSAMSYSVIIRLTHSVAYKLTMKRKNVQKKVGEYMGGKVLDLPEIRIYHQGEAAGIKKGEAAGIKKGEAAGIKKGEAERKRLEGEIRELQKRIEILEAAQSSATP